MKHSCKLLCILLAMLLAFSSCGGAAEAGNDTTAGDTTPVETETETELTDSVPELDFGGATFTISNTEQYAYEMDVEEQTGEITSDAVYNRNQMMEERFNVTIVSHSTANPSHTEHPNFIRTSVLANDHAFDLAGVFVYTAGTLVLENLFMNWANVPYVDMSMPWWASNINNAFTVDGKLYTAVSDLCVTSMQLTYAYLFNQKIATDNDIENLFDVVDEGRWTLDYVYDLTEGMYQDTNGDGIADDGDVYGLLTDMNTSLNCYMATSEQPTLSNTADGLTVRLGDERAHAVFDKLNKLINESQGTFRIYHGRDGRVYDDKYPIFTSNHALLMPVRLVALFNELRNMEVDFGILPFPKYDEEQKNYYSFSLDNYSVLGVPSNAENAEMVGALVEAMSAESKKSVMPAYYDKALQGKYTRDERSAQMLEVIMDGRTFDMSILYSAALGDLPYFVSNTLVNQENYASSYAAAKQKYESAAAELYAQLKDMQ